MAARRKPTPVPEPALSALDQQVEDRRQRRERLEAMSKAELVEAAFRLEDELERERGLAESRSRTIKQIVDALLEMNGITIEATT